MKEEKELINKEKWDRKDKIIAVQFIIIIVLLIILLVKVVTKDKHKFVKSINGLEINAISKTYAMHYSDTRGFKFEIKCEDVTKIDIETTSGSMINEEGTLSALGENLYTVTCNDEETVFWTPDDTIKDEETTIIKFKSEDKLVKEFNIQKDKKNIYTLIN